MIKTTAGNKESVRQIRQAIRQKNKSSNYAEKENKNKTKQSITGANKVCRLMFDLLLIYSLPPSQPSFLIV